MFGKHFLGGAFNVFKKTATNRLHSLYAKNRAIVHDLIDEHVKDDKLAGAMKHQINALERV